MSSKTVAMWSTSRRVPWNALLAVRVANKSASGVTPLALAASGRSSTRPTAPAPRMVPLRRLSNGSAACSTSPSVVAAPLAKSLNNQGIMVSLVTLSAPITTTRRQRPSRIQSSARAMACIVDAQALLMRVLGPRAPMNSAKRCLPHRDDAKEVAAV